MKIFLKSKGKNKEGSIRPKVFCFFFCTVNYLKLARKRAEKPRKYAGWQMTKHAKKPLAFGSKRPKPTFICTGFLKKLKKNYFEENGKNGM